MKGVSLASISTFAVVVLFIISSVSVMSVLTTLRLSSISLDPELEGALWGTALTLFIVGILFAGTRVRKWVKK